MIRSSALALPGLVLVVAASCSSPPPGAAVPVATDPTGDASPVALGVAVDARDDRGAPRLVRGVVRPASRAGLSPELAAREHLAALAPLWLAHRPAAERALLGVQAVRGGGAIVRLAQRVGGIDLHQGELRVMVHGDGALAAVSGTVQADRSPPVFSSTAAAAADRALDALYGPARAHPAIGDGAVRGGYQELAVAPLPGFWVHSARVRRELLPDVDSLVPAWSVEVVADATGPGGTEPAARRLLIGDGDGRVLRDIDLTEDDAFVYRAFAETTDQRRPLDGPLADFTPHPTGVPDGSLPGPGPYPLVVMEAFNVPHDPWLGPTATTTSGNNVDAFAQTAAGGASTGDIRPEVRAGRVLDYRYDFAAEPLATPTQSKAAAVNAFYVTNWLHDWYYDSGFTEATGNAQVDNFGRGGIAGDPLVVHAQEGAQDQVQRNNSSMTTPADGLSPTMHMFLWTGAVSARLTTPAGAPTAAGFNFGPRNFDVTGTVVVADDQTGGTHEACGPVTSSVAGKIALFEYRINCSNVTALANLAAAGAIGAIARFALPGQPAQILAGSQTSNLPGLVVGDADGQALEAAAPFTATVHRETTVEHDGDLDNALVAHEWGHSMFRRLTSCQTVQCNAMSEGWSDFIALHMMLRETDDRTGTFGVTLYAPTAGGQVVLGRADPAYFGLRRFPYSIDRGRNALSFRHIANGEPLPDLPINPFPARNINAEVHNAGEIWTTMLWEAYNALLDAHPFADARRRMSDYIVAGMMLTPPDATITEARDAILAATGALDTDDLLVMAAAFAGRGAGSCAVSPPQTSRDLIGVVESGTIAARLEASAPSAADDGASCDHDGYLDPGETGTLRITVANTGPVPAEDVVVTATAAAPGVRLGAPVRLGSLAALTQVDVAIPIAVSASAPPGGRLDVAIAIDGDAGCNTARVTAELHAPLGVDEAAAVATRDGFETQQLAWTQTGGPGPAWQRVAETSGNHVLFGADPSIASDAQVVSPVLEVSPTEPLVVTAQHSYKLGALPPLLLTDGGVIELSSDGGATWRDVTALGVDPGYTVTIFGGFGSPLGTRRAFGATNPSFPAPDPLVLDFGTQLAGQAIQLRFRLATGTCCGGPGWRLDDIAVTGITNHPFPALVPEAAACTQPVAAEPAPATAVTRRRARASLRSSRPGRSRRRSPTRRR